MSIIRTIVAVIIGITLSLFSLGCGSPLVQQLAIPSISQILPQTLSAGSSGATMKVMGSNFTNQTSILWNGSALATTYVDPSTLTVAVTAAQLATPTTVQLQVQNGQTGTASAAVPLAIASPLATSSTLTISSPVLPAGLVGTSYSAVFSASGGTPGYTWSITSGSLPTGLSLASTTGVIAGTPTESGSFTFKVTARDSVKQAQTATVSATIVIVAKTLAIKTTSLAAGTSGTIYSQQLLATGGTPAYIWSISSGSLPSGLNLSATTGVITGTPTVSGTFALGLAVTDSGKPVQTASITTSIVLAPQPLKITTTSLASGIGGTTYSQTLQATGGTPAYTWSLASGSLPTGLTLSTAGVISGTSWASGTFSFGVTVKDSAASAQSVTTAMMITIAPKPLAIKTSAMNAGSAGSYYSQTLAATGGTAPYNWSLSTGALPPGLSLSTGGVIFGTPTIGGNFEFGLTVTDSSNPQQTSSISTLIVVAPGPLSISTTSLAAANQGVAYSQTLQAAGGTPSYRWSITSGSLPAGLTLSSWTGVISGTPTASGTFTLGVTVQDRGNPQQKVTSTLTLSVIAPAAPPLVLGAVNLPSATATLAFSGTLSATGGTAPYTWTISSGQLPTGLSLAASTGVISGTPTVSGTFTAGVTLTDGGKSAQTAAESVTIVVAASPLTILTTTLAPATGGTAYSASLQVSGGTPSYTWTIASGSLPAGLNLASTGVISGTPTATGTFSLGLLVTDKCNPVQSKTAALSLTVNPSALTTPVSALNSGTVGVAYSQALTATGGTPAYTWSITSGSLPAGLTLAASTGVVSGNPTTSGTSVFTATVHDNSNPVQTQSLATSILIAPAATSTGPGTTWYIRPDGGTRYSANQTSGQCDGKGDVAYSGSGTNQHCAFNDYRYLWDDWSYGKRSWVIAGGDTVIIRGCVANAENGNTNECRVGFDLPSSAGGGYTWCFGGNGSGDCSNPNIPSGTASQHTRILGQNYASCSNGNAVDKSKLTQIFGGYGVYDALNLNGAQYVDVQCLEITSHAQCIVHGSPAVPKVCSPGVDDYDSSGISTDINTHDLLLQDLSIHGHTDRGIKGPIGGVVTALRVDIAYNGMAGWDFDDGTGSNAGYGTASLPGSVWNFNYSTIEWNGCNQIYPSTNADTCYDDLDGAYGDGVATPPGMCLSANIDHSAFNYNTQDGIDLGHIDTGSCSLKITNSTAVGNMGATFKWGPNENPAIFTDNVMLANCGRLSQPIAGTSSHYNQNLQHWCRSGDNVSFNFRQGGTALVANNTVVGYESTSYDINCWDGSCSDSTLTFKNNITLGYDNPLTYSIGGQAGGVGGIYFQNPIGTVARTNNLWYGMRASSFNCPTGYPGEICADPLLVSEPTGRAGNFVETELDNFNFNLTYGSPAIGAGLYLPDVTLDYTGAQRANPPSIGAYEK